MCLGLQVFLVTLGHEVPRAAFSEEYVVLNLVVVVFGDIVLAVAFVGAEASSR